MKTKKVILKRGKEVALQRRHPWVFSGAVYKAEGNPQNGDIVHVYSAEGQALATGFYSQGSIAIRLFEFDAIEADAAYWQAKIAKAIAYRKTTGIFDAENTNVFRLINAEGDGVPGLIIDYYNGVAVVQCHTEGTYQIRPHLVAALTENLGDRLLAIYDKSAEASGIKDAENGYLYKAAAYDGSAVRTVVENGLQFLVDWETGQKTGFFIDQRDNRKLLADFSKGKKVLNTFCYTGGFSVFALQAGAALVHSVDSSAKAMELVDKNVALNFPNAKHESFTSDVFTFFKNTTEVYHCARPSRLCQAYGSAPQRLGGLQTLKRRGY